jgi:hypothetical protein
VEAAEAAELDDEAEAAVAARTTSRPCEELVVRGEEGVAVPFMDA